MAQLLFAKKQINVKIVYYGPGLSGKATCFEFLQKQAPGTVGGVHSVEVDGEQAVSMAQSEAPELILMDLSLPVIDGWEATRQIKANQETTAIPIIARSGRRKM